ncbi:MAG: 2OG-Fe(II) oxygenase [Pseudomonadota bacterium]
MPRTGATDPPVTIQPIGIPVVDRIAEELRGQDWCVVRGAVPGVLLEPLRERALALHDLAMRPAGIGRETDHVLDRQVRRDRIHWISGETKIERAWLAWAESLRLALNRRLLLGLFSFESHFAHYGSGDFYRLHLDAFRDQPLAADSGRMISVVLYLNPEWSDNDGGELLIHDRNATRIIDRVKPEAGTVAVFLSESVPHEVLAAARDRFSIAGWFRMNGSTGTMVDPPS